MSPRLLFRTFATAEVVTWAGLITALILRAACTADLVSVAGGVHGFVFLSYCVITVFVWVNERWRVSMGIVGLASSVIPFATLPFELVVDHRGLLSKTWRLAPGGDEPQGLIEKLQAWVLRYPLLSVLILVVGVTVVFVVLLWMGPPVPKA